MRIAVLTNDYPPTATGGAGVIAEIQVRELERRGHVVNVIVCRPEWKRHSAAVRLVFHLFDLRAQSRLCEDVLRWKPDVLLTHNLTGCGFGTPRAIQKTGVRWVHVLHDVQLIEPSGQILIGESWPLLRSTWRTVWSALRRRSLGSPEVVVSPTRWLLDVHTAYGFFRSLSQSVIPNPLPLGIRSAASQAESNLLVEKKLLYVGRVDRDKGIDVLVEAWQSLGKDRPRLAVVGDGERRRALSEMSDIRLEVRGPQPHAEVLKCMSECSVVVVPSLVMENQPTTILEALALERRVVGSAVGGIPETLKDAGWIVPPGDVPALAVALRQALANEGDALLREEARKKILESHRVEVVVGELESLLRSNL